MSNAPKPGPPAKATAPAKPVELEPTVEPEPTVTIEDVAALIAAPVVAAPANLDKPKRRIVVSQGAYDDLARLGKVTDAGSGHELRVGDDGAVTAYDRRTGKPADVDVFCPRVERA